MKNINVFHLMVSSLFFVLIMGVNSPTLFAQSAGSNYIVVDSGSSQRQNIYIYNQGRLETEILSDNSMIQYDYDVNGNLLKRTKGYSIEPYVFGISAVSYDIYIKGVQHGAQQVHFPTWTDQNGQDDIEWIPGEKLTNGVWKGTVIFNKHGGQTGTYITHIYADGKNVGSVVSEVRNDEIIVTSPQEASLAEGSYDIQVRGIADSVKEVNFPTWTENNGQDDLVNPWIVGEKLADGSWRIKVPFSNHNFETGNYITHLYSSDKYGNKTMLGGRGIHVKGGAGGSKETDLSGVSYDVFIYGVDPQIQTIHFPTWTAYKDQDDIEWIEGVKLGNGVWKGTIVYSKHNSETGGYITHVYSNEKFLGAWGFDVTNSQNLKAPSTAKISSGYYEVSIEGIPANVTRVEFPTWTDHKGQDDIEWGQGERESANKWKVKVPFSNHSNETGVYITHVYTHDAYGNMRGVSGISVDVRN